jgi:hypothetical protein
VTVTDWPLHPAQVAVAASNCLRAAAGSMKPTTLCSARRVALPELPPSSTPNVVALTAPGLAERSAG